MKAYLAIKFKPDESNKGLIDVIAQILEEKNIETSSIVRDYQPQSDVLDPVHLMQGTFKAIDEADFLLIEFSEKGVGLGIEAGYAYAKGKPIYVIAREGSEISETMQGLANKIIVYATPTDLRDTLAFLTV